MVVVPGHMEVDTEPGVVLTFAALVLVVEVLSARHVELDVGEAVEVVAFPTLEMARALTSRRPLISMSVVEVTSMS